MHDVVLDKRVEKVFKSIANSEAHTGTRDELDAYSMCELIDSLLILPGGRIG